MESWVREGEAQSRDASMWVLCVLSVGSLSLSLSEIASDAHRDIKRERERGKGACEFKEKGTKRS